MKKLVFLVTICSFFSLNAFEKLILVTGCARSGTTYMTKVLRASGLDVKHEEHGKDGTVSWTMAVNANNTPWGPPFKEGRYMHIFHQVREPLKTIASVIVTEPQESWNFIRRHIPEIKDKDSKLIKAVKYWIYWNQKAEAKAEMTYRVEDIEWVLGEIGERIGHPLSIEAIANIPKTTNHRKDYEHLYTWKELQVFLPVPLYIKLRDQAIRYGYL